MAPHSLGNTCSRYKNRRNQNTTWADSRTNTVDIFIENMGVVILKKSTDCPAAWYWTMARRARDTPAGGDADTPAASGTDCC